MKIPLLSTLVSILVLSTAISIAASYTIPIPTGTSLIANHLDTGGNTLDEVLPVVPDGTQIQKWNCPGLTVYTYDQLLPGWTPAGGTLNPGEGAFINNNSGSTFNLTFNGTPHAPLLPPSLPCGCGQDNPVSRQTTNSPSTFDDIMGFPPGNGTGLQKWNGAGFDNYTFNAGVWSPSNPVVNLGEAVFIRIPACSATPIITCATNKTVECGTAWTFDLPTGIGGCSTTNVTITILSTITNGLCPQDITRTWLATDLCGNTNTCSQTVTAVDTTPPVLTCADDKTANCGTAWTFDSPTVTDACCGTNVTITILNTLTNGSGCSESVTRTWQAEDCCTNIALCSQTVTLVIDTNAATIVSVNSIINNGIANSIGLCFDEEVTLPSATNPLNYSAYIINVGPVNVTSVTLRPDGHSVELFLASPVGEFFSLGVTNVMDVANNAIAEKVTGYMSDYFSTTVGTPGDPNPVGQVYTCRGDSFEVTVGGSDIGGTSDHFHFINQAVIGDFDARVRVTRLDLADPFSKAGLMARENFAPDSRTIQTYFTPTQGPVNQIQATVRPVTGGGTVGFEIPPPVSADPLRWLRLTRLNDVFTTYHSTDGVDWVISGVTTQAFHTNLFVGLAVSSHNNGAATRASVTDFSVQGARPGDEILPTLSAAVSGTNLVLQWLRTPQDFAVEVATNLSSSAQSTNSTGWSFLLLPIRQPATNPETRFMDIPVALIDQPLFMRLARVGRVIPQNPLNVSPGIILSPGSNLSSAPGTANTLCTYTVISATAYAQTSAQIIAPKSTAVTFTTEPSDTSVDTVLQVRRLPMVTGTCDDNALTGRKARVIMTMTSATTLVTNTFSLIVAVKTNAPSPYTAQSLTKVRINY